MLQNTERELCVYLILTDVINTKIYLQSGNILNYKVKIKKNYVTYNLMFLLINMILTSSRVYVFVWVDDSTRKSAPQS